MIAEIDGLLAKPEADKPAASQADEDAKPASTLTASAPAETPAPALVARASDPAPEPAPRRRWWLWGVIGAVVVGGAVTAVVLSTGGTTTIHDGSLATLRR
jgi:ferric-dicitrate binding protein FerR (iron transport regulator)